MNRASLVAFSLAFAIGLSACGSHHQHSFTEADCVNPSICSKCGAIGAEALGHTTSIGVCLKCEETQNEELLENINLSFAEIMDDGAKLIDILNGVTSLSPDEQYDSFIAADSYATSMRTKLLNLIDICSGEKDLERMVYQASLLEKNCPEAITGADSVSLKNQTVLYQLFMQQLSSSFSFLSEDMAYLAGTAPMPEQLAFFEEVPEMPRPDSVIYGVTYDSEKSVSGVKQYIYLIGNNESDANLNYNLYLSALESTSELKVSIEDTYSFVTIDGEMVSAMMAGTDSIKGYFLIVSFQEK